MRLTGTRVALSVTMAAAMMVGSNTAGAADNDIDGDGVSDVVIGAPDSAESGAGFALASLSANPDVRLVQSSPVVPGIGTPENRFGHTVTMADFDGDGFADVAIGAPRDYIVWLGVRIGCGSTAVLYGSATGFAGGALLTSTGCVGGTSASGDLNGDGFADLATGNGPSVTVFYGGPAGLDYERSFTFSQDTPGMADTVERGDGIGHLAIGSFDGDPYDDLAIGIPYEDVGLPGARSGVKDAGAIHIVRGSVFGVLPHWSTYWTKGPVEAGSPLTPTAGGSLSRNDLFGSSLCASDFDTDGVDELVVGVPGEIVNRNQRAGAVRVLHGGINGPSPSDVGVLTQNSPTITGRAERLDQFGSACASGDIDDDGHPDLLISAGGEIIDVIRVGAVHAIFGSAAGLLPTDNDLLIPGPTISRFGRHVYVGDADGDGVDDALIAAEEGSDDFVLIGPGGPRPLLLSLFATGETGDENSELGVFPS